MKNRKPLGYALLAAAVVLSLISGGCQSVPNILNEPAVSFHSVSITDLSFTGAEMLAKINLKNDNPISIPFPELDWELMVSGGSFIKGTVTNGKAIAARTTTVVDVPFSVTYEELYKVMSNLIGADEAPYQVNLGVRFPIPLLDQKTFTASFDGSIPMLKIPALSFGGVKFNSLSLSKVEFVLTWAVDNKNAFALNLDKLDYRFSVNGASWASGSAPKGLSLPARGSTQIPITVSINTGSMIQSILSLAVGGKAVSYECGGEAALALQGLDAAALRLPFTYSGTTTLRP